MVLRTFHWRAKEPLGNFGDALTLLYIERLFGSDSLLKHGTIHLVGSVITPDRISQCLKDGYAWGDGLGRAIFWGCGKKDADPLAPHLMRRSIFFGVRGEFSRKALGLPTDTPLGDTALLLPQFYRPQPCPATAGKVLFVPHVHHPPVTEDDLRTAPENVVLSPAIANSAEACAAFIDAIASARFVMANAMHAAVVALAYGVPFAFWSGRYVNVPFKWSDLASGVGFELPFAASFDQAEKLYADFAPGRAFTAWNPAPLLDVSPLGLKRGN